MNRWLTQTEFGVMYGVSSHRIGKWLVEAGVRDRRGRPTQQAFLLGIVQKRPCKNPGTYFYVWAQAEVEVLFHELGYERPLAKPLAAKGGA